MAALYRSGLHAPWDYVSRSEPNDLSPLYVVVVAARRLLKDGYPVDLPEDYDLEVLNRVAWLTGDYGVRVQVSARQADEVNQIARTLEQQHQDVLRLAEREAIALLRRTVEGTVTTLVKRGTARRLGLRPWSRQHQIPLSYVQMPDGSRHKLVCAGSRARTTFVTERGSAVHNVPIELNVGAGSVLTRWGTVVLSGDTKEVQSVNTDDVRDWMTQADPANAGLIMSRDRVVNQWCKEHGKDKDHLAFADIAAIRALPQWINAG